MSPRRLWLVARADFAYASRRVLFWVWALILILLTWGLSYGVVRIQSGDSTVGGTKAHITSEFAVAQQMMILTPLVYGFFLTVAAGMAIIADEEARVGEVLHATPLRPGEYVWGKFLGVFLAVLGVLLIHTLSMWFFYHALPAGSAREFRGAFQAGNYLRPMLLFIVPTLLLLGGAAFALGEWTRRPVVVFILPVAVLLGCAFFLWSWSPRWLDPRIDRLMMLVDPAGFRWLSETWLKGDRGVQFYNTSHIPLDATIVANRLLAAGLGLAAVALSHRHFARGLRGAAVNRKVRDAALSAAAAEPAVTVIAPERSLASLGMTARRPGLLAGAWTVARAELAELRSSPGLYLFVPLLMLESFAQNIVAVGAFDTPLLMTPGTMAVRSFAALATYTCMLLMFYTVESLSRDRATRLSALADATPLRTGSLLIGKAAANAAVGVVILAAQLVVSLLALLWQRKVGMDLRPFVLIWGLLLVPTLLFWTAFVAAVFCVTRNRYATYAIGLAVLSYTGYRQITGQINYVGNWALWSALRWSDISVLEFDRSALALNRGMVLGLAVFCVALTVRFYPRRETDPTRLMLRLRPLALLKASLPLIPLALVPIALGSVLYVRVDRGFQGDTTQDKQKDYWRKNLATYKDWPVPDIAAVDVAVDLEPARGRLGVDGSYELVNTHDKPVRVIPITPGPHWEKTRWTLDGKAFKPEDRAGLQLFQLPAELPKGKTVRIGFAFEGSFPRGISSNGGGTGEFVLPSAVVLTSFGTSFVPAVGFNEGVGVDDDNRYESKEYPDDYYKGPTESFVGSRAPFRARVKVTGPADFTLNSIGTAVSDTVSGDRRTTVWESEHPVNFFNVVAGRWVVKKGKGTAVYHDPRHAYNVDEILEALDAARENYSAWFMPFPWKELKLSEFPALADYAQGFPTDITFSESIGFLTKSDPRANTAFLVAAHESAHQWWGNLVAPGRGPGGNLLSEGTSHFSTILLFEKVKGLRQRIEFTRGLEDRYGKTRRADSERPLFKTDGTRDGDQTVTYDKAGMVFWMLSNLMGRDRMLEGVRDFFRQYHENPDHPVLQDFLDVLRPHAPDPAAFDAFRKQWFESVVVPEYQFSEVKRTRVGNGWEVTAKVSNVGTGTMPVEVAAVRGERFPDDASKPSEYREARATVTPAEKGSATVTIRCDFEPERLEIDPDIKVLQLRRKSATANLK